MNSFDRNGSTREETDLTRARKRDSLFLAARLTIAGKTHDVRVRNLSEGGLMAEYAAPVTTGTVVALEVRGVGEVTGHVAWSTDGRIGIAFDHPIDPARARKPVGTGASKSTVPRPLVVSARRR